jgi:hypothetical protein
MASTSSMTPKLLEYSHGKYSSINVNLTYLTIKSKLKQSTYTYSSWTAAQQSLVSVINRDPDIQ